MKKAIIITAIIIFVLAVSSIAIVALNSSIKNKEQNQQSSKKIAITLTDIQDLYTKLDDKEVVIEFMKEQYFKDNDNFRVSAYDDEGNITLENTQEYITFDIIHEEVDSPDTAVNFVYHEQIGNYDTFIMKSGENSYLHYNGGVTNEFETIYDAIADHQYFRPEA